MNGMQEDTFLLHSILKFYWPFYGTAEEYDWFNSHIEEHIYKQK